MDLKYNFSKAIQIVVAVDKLTKKEKFTTIQKIYEETFVSKNRIRQIVKLLKSGNILAGANEQVWFEKDPKLLTFKDIKQVLGKDEMYIQYQSKDAKDEDIQPFKQILAEKFIELQETIDFYWEHLTVRGFQNDLNSLRKTEV